MGETFLPLYFYNTERIFIPPLQSSVRFSDVWPLADMMTYPELDMDQELIYSALEFAQNVPDFKTCFPEIWNDIVDVCSRDSTFISEYQYTVMALRIFNCLHHRSLGIEEIDFEFIDQDYVAYLAVMTGKEGVLYQKMYNVARGLCLNEKQDRTIRDVRRRAENIENSVARYLNRVRRIKTHLATSTKVNTKKTNIKQGVHGTFINETGRSLKEFKQNSAEKFKKYIRVMKNVVYESNSCSKSVDTSLDLVAKNFRKIGHILQGEKRLKRSWINFAQEYSRKTTEMERKVASIETKLGKILKHKLK
ncbi:Hypothetical predicted protein [Paramuricea clavata]|nr:Hypothetical predicted protein [Paramuricea clavata]